MAAHTVVGVQASLAPRRSRVAPELTRRGGAPRVRSASARLTVRAAKGDVLLEVNALADPEKLQSRAAGAEGRAGTLKETTIRDAGVIDQL